MFLDALGLGDGEPEIQPVGDGHSNVTYLVSRGDAEFVLRRPPRGPLPPSAHDVLREARVLRALEGRARVPKVLGVCDDQAVIGSPFYLMEKVEGLVVTSEVPPRARQRRGPPAHGRGARGRAGRAARGRLAGGRPRGVRQADRVSRAAAAPLPRPVGDQPHARHPGGRDRRPLARGHDARAGARDDRARRLPPGQHDVRRAGAGEPRRDLRLGDVDDRRPEGRPRLPLHAVDRPRRPARRHVRADRRHARARLHQRATRSSRATRSARAAR